MTTVLNWSLVATLKANKDHGKIMEKLGNFLTNFTDIPVYGNQTHVGLD